MFDFDIRLHRLIYPRCHDRLSGLSGLNLCVERVRSGKAGNNRTCATVIQNAAERSPEATFGRNKAESGRQM